MDPTTGQPRNDRRFWHRMITYCVSVISLVAAVVGIPTAAYASAQLYAPAQLQAGDCLTADLGKFRLCMQGDGNLVLTFLTSTGWAPVWSTGTNGYPGTRLQTQYDGNIVLIAPGEHPIWATGTNGHPGSFIQVQDDGNVVVYDPSIRPLWASNTSWGTTSGGPDISWWKVYSADRSVPPYHDSCLDKGVQYSWVWTCNPSDTNEVWYFTPVGGSAVTLRNDTNLLCLTSRSSGATAGTPVDLETCSGSVSQKWSQERLVYPGWPNGLWWRLRNQANTSMCLTIDKSSGPVHDGSPLMLSDCLPGYNQINQQWRVSGS